MSPRRPDLVELRPGDLVALSLASGAAPLRCYVGEVQAVGAHGLRLTLIDWLVGRPVNWDFFAPWSSITSALVCTPEHDRSSFGDSAMRWQTQMEALGHHPAPAEDGA